MRGVASCSNMESFSSDEQLKGPFEAEVYLRRVPDGVTCKGMFFAELQKAARPHRGSLQEPITELIDRRYVAFRDYPLTEHMRLTASLAPVLYPQEGIRQGLRELGRQAYPTFAGSIAGRVAAGFIGDDINRVLDISSRALQLSLSRGSVVTRSLGERRYRLEFEEIYGYLDSYYVGVVEGALLHHGMKPTVAVTLHSPIDGTFVVQW